MGGEGTMAGMIISIRNNKMLLRNLKFRKRVAWEHLKDPTKAREQKPSTKPLTDEELKMLRAELKKEKRKERIKLFAIAIIMAVLATTLFYFLFTALH